MQCTRGNERDARPHARFQCPPIPPPTLIQQTERRAPTLAPSNLTVPPPQPVETIPPEVPTEVPTIAPSAVPSASPTLAPPTSTRVSATATPNAPPGVYLTALTVDPAEPKSAPATFYFTVAFLNTVGEPVNYPRWRVLIQPTGETRTIGDPQGTTRTIPTGANVLQTETWSIRVASGCESFTAHAVWQDEAGKLTPLTRPDGTAITLPFQICPN